MERPTETMHRLALAAAGLLVAVSTAPVTLAEPPLDPAVPPPPPGVTDVVPVANNTPPAPPIDTGVVASEVPGIATTLDGRTLTVAAKDETQLPVAPADHVAVIA